MKQGRQDVHGAGEGQGGRSEKTGGKEGWGGQETGEGRAARSRRQGTGQDVWRRVFWGTGVPGEGVRRGGVIPPFPAPPYQAVEPVYPPPPPKYPGALPPPPMPQHPQAVRAMWGAQGGKGEEFLRAWQGVSEEERRLQERGAREMGEAAGAVGAQASAQGTPEGGEAQAVEELRRAWMDIRRRAEGVKRAERDGKRQGERAQGGEETESHPPLQPFRQPRIPSEAEKEVQERARKRIGGEAARLEERDREVADWGRRVTRRRRQQPAGGQGSSSTLRRNTPHG